MGDTKIAIPRVSGSYENLLYLLFFPIFFFTPPIAFSGLPFLVDISDIYLVFVGIAILKNKWYRGDNLKLILLGTAVSLYIVLTILINRQIRSINNYFEVYDILKFICFIIFFKEQYCKQQISRILDACFCGLVVFHIFHYYNILNFNEIVMPLYCGADSPHLLFFGYNSIGEPATKRALGTMGNPNMNALLFLFFLIRYAPRLEWKKKDRILFFIALIVFLCCQSRTGMVAFVIMLIINYIFSGISWKKMLVQVFSILAVSAFVLYFAEIMQFLHIPLPVRGMNYSLSLLNSDALKSNSWTERLQIWKELLGMVQDKPIFGFGPNKNYLYENHIYAENEYVLMVWRYGILGLLTYLLLYFLPVWKSLKKAKHVVDCKNVLLMIAVFAVSALTNCPFSNVKLSILLAFVFAAQLSQQNGIIGNIKKI